MIKPKAVVLCGGRGTRIAADVPEIPKALVKIGSRPILWHILRHYSHFEVSDFILALGFRGAMIQQWIKANPFPMDRHIAGARIDCRNTGLDSPTGERLLRLRGDLNETFFATYGDGLSDVDLDALLQFHRDHRRLATVTVVKPYSNFGVLELEGDAVRSFQEKPRMASWVNGGFFVFEPGVLDRIDPGDILERNPMERLIEEDQLRAFRHEGFWKCMDTYKDTVELNEQWQSGNASWALPGMTAMEEKK